MNRAILWSVVVSAGLALTACGTVADEPAVTGAGDPQGGETDDPDDPVVTTTDDPADTEDPATPPGDTDGADADSGGSDDASFLVKPDGMGGISFECDMFAQDCPDGEKCMPWANDGGTAWNATRCSPIADNPGQAGDSCSVEGSGVSGLDDCDIGSMCWDVDPETNMGVCVALCTGDSMSPVCEDPDTACAIVNDGAIVLCLPSCDPLIQDCTDGQACYAVLDDFLCVPDASGEMGVYGDPCEFINACDPGLMCLGAAAVPDCTGSQGCCSEVCDTADPAGDAQCMGVDQACEPWYEEGAAPPGYEDVGACALPA
ncbi:MAG: ribulose phosphate epimerase [Myxococcota bacterium]